MSSSSKQHHSFYQSRHANGKWKPSDQQPAPPEITLYEVAVDSRKPEPMSQDNALFEVGYGR